MAIFYIYMFYACMKIPGAFSQYIKSSPQMVQNAVNCLPKLDRSTVFRLELISKPDFLTESRKIICTARSIPENLWPAIEPINLLYNGVRGFYDFISNTVNYDVLLQTESRAKFFSTLVHEITHMKQNFDILRTKNLGKDYARFLAHLKSLIEVKFCGDDYRKVFRKNLRFFNDKRRGIIKSMGSLPFDDERAKVNYAMAKAMKKDKVLFDFGFNQGSPEYEAEAYLAGKITHKRYKAQLK